jgi:hypothetical protein
MQLKTVREAGSISASGNASYIMTAGLYQGYREAWELYASDSWKARLKV